MKHPKNIMEVTLPIFFRASLWIFFPLILILRLKKKYPRH